MHALARGNEYADALGKLFDEVPKAVFAAIAVSALTNGGDQLAEARSKVAAEWLTLWQNGIVPQPPSRLAKTQLRGE